MATLNNRFVGVVNTINPPLKTYKLEVDKDTEVVEDNPTLNKGSDTDLTVTSTNTAKHGIVLTFGGLKAIASNILRYPSKINLVTNWNTLSTAMLTINVYEYNHTWQENDLTWNTIQPKGAKLKTLRVSANKLENKTDIKNLLLDAIKNSNGEVGFYMETAATDKVCSMYSKESLNPPHIEIEYYDIPNGDVSTEITGSIDVMGLVGKTMYTTDGTIFSENMEITGEINVLNTSGIKNLSYAYIL